MFGGGDFTPGAGQQQQLGANTGFGFSSAPPNASPFTLGSPATAAPTALGTGGFSGFGTPQQPQQQLSAPTTGFSFGAPAATTTPASSGLTLGGNQPSGFSFGTPATANTQAPTGLTLGGTPTSGFSFGAPAAATTQASSGLTLGGTQPSGFSFGTPAATSTQMSSGLTLGGTQPSGFSFGTPISTTTQASSGLTLGGTQQSGFSFGAPATSTQAPSGLTLGGTQPSAFSFGSQAPAISSTGFGLNLGGTTVSSTATQPTPVSSTTFTGLGGVQPSGAGGIQGSGGFGGSAKPEGRAILDLPVPQEILQIVEDLKTHMKNQKVKMSEICRATDKNIEKVSEEVEETRLAVSNLSNQVNRQVLFCNALMKDIQEEMKNVEMALIIKDTPLALQNEITAPTNYFFNLVSNYHERMISYKREIERAEIALISLGQNNAFSPKDLVLGLKGTKDTVIALAAKVQDLHEQIVNEMAVNRNLKRFHIDEEGGSGRRGVSTGVGFLVGHDETRRIGTTYDQAYSKLNVLFQTPPRSGGNESFYRPSASMSTPLINSGMTSQQPLLFQTASSTILGSPGALKRTKH
ncbi:nucleoporin p58/p45 isoform X2 [Folsomia candida]|uniref:nucleoporin p58/p45 isoform X2 n=1 Tax=Folsomia candida TaxID=158441 RepID=UPI000B8F28D5|nr:nucleoporin p58/p45 isoform X2 [Folsomia candida]